MRLQQLVILHKHVAHVAVQFQMTLQIERVGFTQSALHVLGLLWRWLIIVFFFITIFFRRGGNWD